MKYLHISDIHFNPSDDGRATRDLRLKFKDYLAEKRLNDRSDVFFTGDFRHARKQADQDLSEVARNAVNFLRDLAECAGVTDPEHIHIVPGNHDLAREKNDSENSTLLQEIYKQYDPDEGRFTGCVRDHTASMDYLRGRFGFFDECAALLENKVWSEFQTGWIHRYRIFEDYGILYLNTAIASGRDSDRHNLLIGTDDFEKALRCIQGMPLIILAHNPLSHLEYNEQTIVKNLLKDSGNPVLWLCGDVHDSTYDRSYDISCLSAGCMIKQNETEASFYAGEFVKHRGVSISAHCYAARHGYWQYEEALTKRVNESLPDALKPPPIGPMPAINNLPERNSYFTGREEPLRAIAEAFRKSRTVVVKQTISGLGGVGKTQLAREFAYRYGVNYETGIWEINADSAAAVYAGFVEFARIFQIDLPADFTEDDLRQAVGAWMREKDRWLILFDNLDNEDVISSYIPNNGTQGHILVTTRSLDMDFGGHIDLSVFDLGEALCFLDNRLAGCAHLEKDADALKKDLCLRLGCLPLALEQAAAYIKVTRTSFSRYLMLLNESGLEAFEIEPDSFSMPEHYAKSVTTTWEISFNTIALKGAKQLFYLCAYLAPDRIPVKLFAEKREILPEPARSNLSAILETNRIVTELRKYSLTSGNSEYIYIHRLVQEVVRNKLKSDKQWAKYDLQLLYESFSFEYGDLASHEAFLMYIPHVEALVAEGKALLTEAEDQELLALLLSVGGQGYDYLGEYKKSIQWNQKALNIRKNLLGENHYMTAVSYNNLASAYQAAGEYERAKQLYQSALTIFQKELGPDHGTVASAYSNLAGVYDCQGEYDRALEYYQKALGIRLEIFGENHNETADIYNNIAFVHNRLARYQEALETHKKVLEIRIATLGEQHLRTAISYGNVAYSYAGMGDFTKALELQRKVLEIRMTALGPDHPETLTACINLASTYVEIAEFEKALEIYESIIPIYEATRGSDHLDTAYAYNSFAGVYYSKGDYASALRYFDRALTIREKKLGASHPDTATVYGNIASVYEDLGSYDQALEFYEKAAAAWEKRFGREHPSTAEAINSIATIYDAKGDHDKALELYKQALDIREKVLGKDHPDTALSYNNIAAALDAHGDHAYALELYQRVLGIRERVFGKEHPETAAVYNNIAAVYGELGRHEEALDMYQKALRIYQNVLGEEHPCTASVYNNIGTIYDSLGNYSTALELLQHGLDIHLKILGEHHLDTADSYINVAAVLERLGRPKEALALFKKALSVFRDELGDDSIYTIYVQKCIEDLSNTL